MRSKPSGVTAEGDSMVVRAHDELLGEETTQAVDMVVLATGMERPDDAQKFGDMLLGALGSVNDSQRTAMNLSQKMITDPKSVNVEDVTIALADANLALSMTKAIVDRALAAYREIINIR